MSTAAERARWRREAKEIIQHSDDVAIVLLAGMVVQLINELDELTVRVTDGPASYRRKGVQHGADEG